MRFASLPALLSLHPLVALPLVFLGGVLASMTPCIYPMIPITVAVIGGHATGLPVPRGRIAGLTIVYVVGLSTVYATLGLVAGLTGKLFGSVSTTPGLYLLLANLLVVSALMMLDVFPVPLPASLVARAAALQGGGRVAGVLAMGAASGLVVAPCGAPVMATVLTWVATTRSAGLGFIYLLVFSLGMSSLLIALGIVTGGITKLPRSGAWLLWVKRGLAVMMLAVAEYYLVEMGGLLT